MALINLRGTMIGYDDVPGSGALLIFVHGHPFNRSMWQEQIDYFKSTHRLINADLRGYGESTAAADKTMLEEFARDTAALLDELGITEKVILCGLSMGGQIVLEFYRLFPERVQALILADTFAQLDDAERKQARYDTAERLLAEGMASYSTEVLPKMIAPHNITALPDVAAHVLSMMRTTSPQGAAAALRGRAERVDYTPLLAKISVPVLIIVGEHDEFTPVSDAEFMRARIAQAKLIVIENTGHMPNLENAPVFNAAVAGFLKTL